MYRLFCVVNDLSFLGFRVDSVDDWDTISSAPARSIGKESSANWNEAMPARAIPVGTVVPAGRVPTASVSFVCVALATEVTIARLSPTPAGRILVFTVAFAWKRNLG